MKLVSKSLHEMEELKRVQEFRVDESSRRRLIENQDTMKELAARIQELKNEVNCMNDSRVFMDAESVRSGLSHVPSQLALFPPYRDPGRLLSRNVKPPDICWDTHGVDRYLCTIHFMHITLHGSRRATQCVCVARTHSIHMPFMMCA